MKVFFNAVAQLCRKIFCANQQTQEPTVQEPTFLPILRAYMDERIIKKSLSESTATKYGYIYNNVAAFFKDDITLSNVRIPVFEDFRVWIHKTKKCGLTHSSRHLEMCKGAMDYAVRKELIRYNPLKSLETGRDKRKAVINLETDELWRWINYNFENNTFRKVQLLSIFQAATGISYGNLFDYKTIQDDTGLWIEDNRKKVGQKPFFIPLDAPEFAIAKAIHEQFDGQLPRMENATYNRLLKEMTAIVGIEKKLSTHNFRKTFATLMDQDGFELGVISAIMGNSEEICRNHYINTSKKKIQKAFRDRDQTRIIHAALAN